MANNLTTVRNLIEFSVEKNGEKDFCRYIRDGELSVKSYREFYRDCISVCRYINSVTKEKINIAFIGNTSYEYIACLTGMIFSGNTVVPFSPDITAEEAAVLFEDADIQMLFCEEEFIDRADEISKSYDGIKSVVSLGDAAWFAEIFERYSDEMYAEYSAEECNPDECALIIYTSGTTGKRKGVMLSNRNLAANSSYKVYSMDDDDISFSVLPMHHIFCYACDVLKTVFDGGTLCLNGEMVNLYKNLLIFEPTIMRIVPSLCKSILTRIKISEKRHPELSAREAAELVVGKNFRRMIAGSAFLSGAVIDEFEKYGITARQGYGMSECSPRITTSDFSDKLKYSNGVLIGTDDVRVRGGEIQVKGPSVMLGYYKREKETAEAFTEDGYLCSGDLGYIKDNHIFLTGRKKNLVILSNGENISPEEIENRFADEAVIKDVIVKAEVDSLVAEIFPDWLYAEMTGVENMEEALSEIIDKVNTTLKSDRQIHYFKIRETPFRRTSTGKIIRENFYFEEN
ncbi:MAG: AMP-binding protein [Clostridia bacterium]|nr:AMP-binding protein [Clostridia bacterium]